MGLYRQLLIVFSLSIFGCSEPGATVVEIDAIEIVRTEGKTIQSRFSPPAGYDRAKVDSSSFKHYLRNLPLKSSDAYVLYYNGDIKSNSVHAAVVDMEIGRRDLHQCADAIMRLKAEYHWREKQYEQIHFNFTNGDRIEYTEWKKGRRIKVEGSRSRWIDRFAPSNTYKDFWSYLEVVFAYAGTASLSKELQSISMQDIRIGDVFIQGGFPGHAVLVVDMVTNPSNGKKLYMLGQSYMPAQDFHVLINENSMHISPWYELSDSEKIYTPEWTFSSTDLMRFRD